VLFAQPFKGQTFRLSNMGDETEEKLTGCMLFHTETSDIRVIYPLRIDRHIEFLIPKDLTTREAQRLSDFIKTLPFDAPLST
jgi:hypothetical protein